MGVQSLGLWTSREVPRSFFRMKKGGHSSLSTRNWYSREVFLPPANRGGKPRLGEFRDFPRPPVGGQQSGQRAAPRLPGRAARPEPPPAGTPGRGRVFLSPRSSRAAHSWDSGQSPRRSAREGRRRTSVEAAGGQRSCCLPNPCRVPSAPAPAGRAWSSPRPQPAPGGPALLGTSPPRGLPAVRPGQFPKPHPGPVTSAHHRGQEWWALCSSRGPQASH